MGNIEEYYYLSATEYELKIHRELECPNWFKINYPELFRDFSPKPQENKDEV